MPQTSSQTTPNVPSRHPRRRINVLERSTGTKNGSTSCSISSTGSDVRYEVSDRSESTETLGARDPLSFRRPDAEPWSEPTEQLRKRELRGALSGVDILVIMRSFGLHRIDMRSVKRETRSVTLRLLELSVQRRPGLSMRRRPGLSEMRRPGLSPRSLRRWYGLAPEPRGEPGSSQLAMETVRLRSVGGGFCSS
mmetsp:Transcript_92888/g.278635  ORF Transcript_92888/g.278635 Transcript_92888/m.278635 type:complete len:194 (+) Transcript_92888:249-830(+)